MFGWVGVVGVGVGVGVDVGVFVGLETEPGWLAGLACAVVGAGVGFDVELVGDGVAVGCTTGFTLPVLT